uniref:HAT C-terminal dimerisation domain-containing protein n=1 Tax=Strigamia maritima TaxID=126957 RepID=T1JEM7_STRMM
MKGPRSCHLDEEQNPRLPQPETKHHSDASLSQPMTRQGDQQTTISSLQISSFQLRNSYLDEYLKVMGHLAAGLDVLQWENEGFMGILLPTIIITPGLDKRFGKYFDDREIVLASVTHPKFKLHWLSVDSKVAEAKNDLQSQIKQLQRERGLSDDVESQTVDDDNDHYFNFKPLQIDRSASEMKQYLIDPSTRLSILNKYPTIKTLFLHYNTALTSSAAVERLFSSGKLILSALRNRCKASHMIKMTRKSRAMSRGTSRAKFLNGPSETDITETDY